MTAAIHSDDRMGSMTIEYVWGLQYVDELLAVLNAEHGNMYPTWDAQFRITALLDATGEPVERYGYTPYGHRTVLEDDHSVHENPLTGGHGLRIGHQGLRHDAPAAGGLIYNRHRMLHPAVGRFVQRDPLDQNQPGGGYHDGMSLYQYIASSPLRHRDTLGLKITRFRCCDDDEKEAIEDAEAAVAERLPEVKNKLDRHDTSYVITNYVKPENRRITGQRQRVVHDRYNRRLRVVFQQMMSQTESGIKVYCHDECDDPGKHAYVNFYLFGLFAGGYIHFCPSFFQQTERQQQTIFMHELSHYAARTKDLAGTWEPDRPGRAPSDAYYIQQFMHNDVEATERRRVWSHIWPAQ